ncbi:MAG: hypothetical protein M3P23_00035 [Actinomycetota bacterium]|nr:hypothetical protein [Actinomycetota bacterium]
MTWPAVAVEIAGGVVYLLLGIGALIASLGCGGADRRRRFGFALAAVVLAGGVQASMRGVVLLGAPGRHSVPLIVASLLALLPATVFCLLRYEAYRGGAGDRIIHGHPHWVPLLPVALAFVAGAVLVMIWVDRGPPTVLGVPAALMAAMLLVVGWYLMRAQQVRHSIAGGWSLSGLAVTLLFPTWALVEVSQAFAGAVGAALAVVDWLALPAALWFLIESRRLVAKAKRAGSRATLAVSPQRARRPAPWAKTGPL